MLLLIVLAFLLCLSLYEYGPLFSPLLSGDFLNVNLLDIGIVVLVFRERIPKDDYKMSYR